jgi:anti-sigma factor RsiW
MIGHLGARVSTLLDGQMSPAEEERAWDHVHSCHQCRDAVECEGWVKTRLAAMQLAASPAPPHLKGSLLVRGLVDWSGLPHHPALAGAVSRRRHLGLSGIGGGAVGAAVMGVLALGTSPANAPGAVVRPSEDSFGSTLTHPVTTVIDRERPTPRRGHDGPDAPPSSHVLGRTLAP